MASEEDDPIIQEIDVFLAKSLAEKLYLFQYPVRPAAMTYDDVSHLSAKIKPKQQKIELELAIDTISPNYCRSKGEQIALNVDGTCADETNTYSSKLMDKQTFSSIQAINNISRYAAAIYRKGKELLLCQEKLLQIPHDKNWLQKIDRKQKKKKTRSDSWGSTKLAKSGDPPSLKTQTNVNQHSSLWRQNLEFWLPELWVWLPKASERENWYMLKQNEDGTSLPALIQSKNQYVILIDFFLTKIKIKHVHTFYCMLNRNMCELMHCSDFIFFPLAVKVMPFANLMGLMATGTDSTAVLRCIQQVAMLVQGNWVVKSDVLYPKDSCSPHSGVPAEVLCRGRDFVLKMWKFTRERWVVRKELATVIKLPPEDVKDFLEQMSIPRINKGWEFMLPYDAEFIRKHPDVVQRQHMLWLGIQAKLEKVYSLSKEDLMPKKPGLQPGVPVTISGGQRVQIAKDKVIDNYGMLERELNQQKSQTKSNAASVNMDVTNIRIKEEPVSDEEPMDTSPSGSVNNGMSNGIHSDENSLDSLNGQLPSGRAEVVAQELRKFVQTTFRKHFVITMSELKRLFNLHLASLPPGHTLFSGISDRMLQETVLDSGCKQILVPFPIQCAATEDEKKVFALWETGDTFDQRRQALLEIFFKNYRVRRNVIQVRLNQDSGEDMSKQEVDRLLKECCESYGGMWYLKGTIQS
uniref:RNA polymerase III subunit E n=1 Tax=Latimeria chalumnae TaxID=7897 RepID=H3B6U4_LATCH